LEVTVLDFGLRFGAEVVELTQKPGSGEIDLTLDIAPGVVANMLLRVALNEEQSAFAIEGVQFRLASTDDSARADFIASTLNAALTLSNEACFRVGEIGLDLRLSFQLAPIEISQFLQARQTSHRLMTIERATGLRFSLPAEGFSGVEIGAIVFVFRAIVDRVFTYPLTNGVLLEVEANASGHKLLRSIQDTSLVRIGPEQVSKRLLGIDVPLGPLTVEIRDAEVEDLDQVLGAVATNDGRRVHFTVRSLTNQATYMLPDAPRLAPNPWEGLIQVLVSLEHELDRAMLSQYNALAAATLTGLTQEEKGVVTKRPAIDADQPTNGSEG
jgi:hypothetical protein